MAVGFATLIRVTDRSFLRLTGNLSVDSSGKGRAGELIYVTSCHIFQSKRGAGIDLTYQIFIKPVGKDYWFYIKEKHATGSILCTTLTNYIVLKYMRSSQIDSILHDISNRDPISDSEFIFWKKSHLDQLQSAGQALPDYHFSSVTSSHP